MSKKSRDIELFIVDVFVTLEKIRQYTKDFSSADDFRHSNLHWDASIRQLEILGEALNHLLSDEKFSKHAPTYFRKIVNFRNVIVHEYFGIDEDEVWDVITNKLTLLQKDMKNISVEIDISAAASSVLDELVDEDIKNMLQQFI